MVYTRCVVSPRRGRECFVINLRLDRFRGKRRETPRRFATTMWGTQRAAEQHTFWQIAEAAELNGISRSCSIVLSISRWKTWPGRNNSRFSTVLACGLLSGRETRRAWECERSGKCITRSERLSFEESMGGNWKIQRKEILCPCARPADANACGRERPSWSY